MKTLEQILSGWAWSAFAKAFPGTPAEGVKLDVIATTDEAFGDYQCNAAMALGKVLKRKPRDVAQALVDAGDLPACVARTEIAGPGFINFHLKSDWLASHMEELQKDERLGTPAAGEGHTIVIDYSSPNIAKPMHIGHIRSTVIGNALDRIHRFIGYRVLADNHLGDWGTQFGILILGYRNFLNADALASDPIAELERLYVESYNRAKSDETWMSQARAELVKLQQGDAENLGLWRKFVDLSLQEFERVYKRLGVRFDLVRGESHYNDRLQGIVDLLKSSSLAEMSEGALVVKLEDLKLPLCIVQKSDGAFNYATTDLATVQSRIEEFHPDKIIYVTDERQQLHFRQFFAIARKLGWKSELVHIWFGLMRLPEGTFSTREGNVIKLERLLDEAEARALAIVKETVEKNVGPTLPEEEQHKIARIVGIGAVKYADLSQNPQSLVTFSWDKALALEGNSAPYLQYAHARISSVHDKYAERFPGKDPASFPIAIVDPLERRLAIRVARFPDVLLRAADAYRPNMLCDYLFDLAQVYSAFYQNVPFLKADEGVRESRVRLCDIVARTLRTGLDLLGIESPERI
jgi:arginyl-tRNA synthetase